MPHPEDTTQAVRMILLVLGASVGLIGMVTDTAWLVYGALAIVAAGLALALARRVKMRRTRS
jgi:hypothetical protein